MWDKVPKLSANGQDLGPHYLQEKGLFSICTNVVKKDITSKIPFKTKILLATPSFILQLLLKTKHLLKKYGIDFSVYH